MTKMWIERRALDDGRTIKFCVMEEGQYWPNQPRVAANLRPICAAELWLPRTGDRDPQVSWPSTSDKRPALAMMLGHAMQFAAIEAEHGTTARVFQNGGHFAPRGLEVSV